VEDATTLSWSSAAVSEWVWVPYHTRAIACHSTIIRRSWLCCTV